MEKPSKNIEESYQDLRSTVFPEALRKEYREIELKLRQQLVKLAAWANDQWRRGYPNDSHGEISGYERLTVFCDEDNQFRVRLSGFGPLAMPITLVAEFARKFRDREAELAKLKQVPGCEWAYLNVKPNKSGSHIYADTIEIIIP